VKGRKRGADRASTALIPPKSPETHFRFVAAGHPTAISRNARLGACWSRRSAVRQTAA